MDSTAYDIALVLHLLGAFLFLAGIVVAGVAFEAARRRREPGEIALLLSLSRYGVVLVAIGSLLIPVFGLWLVHLGRWGYGSGWVDASMALFAAALVLGGVGGQRPKRARKIAAGLAAQHSAATPEVRALLDDRLARAGNYASLLLIVAVIVLMVFK